MFKKKKGQGALEYLLLIGGAVLITVIVIALLVGMGGQSRDTAQDQANRVQSATDVPQPAQIISVDASYNECTQNGDATITVNWRALGEGGSHRLYVSDSSNKDLNITNLPNIDSDGVNVGHERGQSDGDNTGPDDLIILNPNNLAVTDFNIGNVKKCGDSYYVRIETTKNNQTVVSAKYQFSWVN